MASPPPATDARRGPLSGDERRAYELGRRLVGWGDVEGALGELERFLETRPGFADVHYLVGTLHERRGDLESANRSFESALRLNPGYAEALLALASLAERRGDFDRSARLAERASELALPSAGVLDPTTRAKLGNQQAELADAYREAGELHDAIEGYRKALDRCPRFHDVRYRLGVALREAGRPDAALAEFARVLRGNPRFLAAAVQQGVTLYSLGRSREAVERWRAVLADDPGCEDARMYLRLVGADDAEDVPPS